MNVYGMLGYLMLYLSIGKKAFIHFLLHVQRKRQEMIENPIY